MDETVFFLRTNCRLQSFVECIVREPQQHTALPYTRVADEQQLEQVVVFICHLVQGCVLQNY